MGPRLAPGHLRDLRDRCAIASVRLTSSEPGCDEGAVVPSGDWQPLTDNDLQRLQADTATPRSALIELVRRPLPAFHPNDTTGRLEAAARLDPLGGAWPTELLGCATSPADQLTTTEDSTTGLRIGLHVDNFDRLPYPRRHQSRRRLGLNLGPGQRYLLIGDHDIQQICRRQHNDLERHYPHTNDLRQYVAARHPLRCLRLRLDPGEGYIAPTELLPHDGSTAGVHQPSVIAFWLGQHTADKP